MFDIKNHPSYRYAVDIVNNAIKLPDLFYDLNGEKKFISPKYVKKQCKIFLDIANGKSEKYIITESRVKREFV